MHAAQPGVDSIKLNKIRFALEHRLAWFGYLKPGPVNNLSRERMSTIVSVLYSDQRLFAVTYPLQGKPQLGIT